MFILSCPTPAPPHRGEETVMVVKLGGFGLTSSTRTYDLQRPAISSLYQTRGTLIALTPAENPISELRRISGLTWEQLTATMGVERRTLHLWEAGRGMRPVHEERLQRVLLVVRRADRGSSSTTRALLLDGSQGPSVKELLSQDHFEEALQRVKALPEVSPVPRPPRLSGMAKEARRPLPLGTQIALKEDAIEPISVRQARPARITRVQKS
jgi:hypothetical protein